MEDLGAKISIYCLWLGERSMSDSHWSKREGTAQEGREILGEQRKGHDKSGLSMNFKMEICPFRILSSAVSRKENYLNVLRSSVLGGMDLRRQESQLRVVNLLHHQSGRLSRVPTVSMTRRLDP